MTTPRDNEVLVTVSRRRPDGRLTHTRVIIEPDAAPLAVQLETVAAALRAALRGQSPEAQP